MIVIATHWESDWREHCEKISNLASLFDPDIDKVKDFIQQDDQESLEHKIDDQPVQMNILKLAKLQDTILTELLKNHWPGLKTHHQKTILEQVNGHVLSLMEIISLLSERRSYFEDRDPQKPLTQKGIDKIKEFPNSSRKALAKHIFNKELHETERILLGFGSGIGLRFKEGIVADAANRARDGLDQSFGELDWRTPEEGLKKLGKQRILAKIKDSQIWEFRDNIYFEPAWDYYKEELSNFRDVLADTNRTDILERVKSCFDESGELIDLGSKQKESEHFTKSALFAISSSDRREDLKNASNMLEGERMSKSSNEPPDFRARCLLFREYAKADMGGQARGVANRLKEYIWDEEDKNKGYVQKLGPEFRGELRDLLKDVGSYDAALKVAFSLEIYHREFHAPTDENRESLGKSKFKIAEIIFEKDKDGERDLGIAEQQCDDAKNIFDELFKERDSKPADPKWYKYLTECNMLLSQIIDEKGEKKEAVQLLSTSEGHIERLCDASNTLDHQEVLADLRWQIGELENAKENWGEAEDAIKRCKDVLSHLCSDDRYAMDRKGTKDYVLHERYAACLEKLKEISLERKDEGKVAEYSEECLRARKDLAEKALKDYNNEVKINPDDFYQNYASSALGLAKDDEASGRLEDADTKLSDCREAWRKCCEDRQKGSDGGIIARRMYGEFLYNWGTCKYESAIAHICSARQEQGKAKKVCRQLDNFFKGAYQETESSYEENRKYCRSGENHVKNAFKNIEEAKRLMDFGKGLLEECEEIRHSLVDDVKSADNYRDEADVMLSLVNTLYQSYELVGSQSQDVSVDRSLDDMEKRINRTNSLCENFRKELIDDRKRIEKEARDILDKVKSAKEQARRKEGHRNLCSSCEKLENKFSEYHQKLDKCGGGIQTKVDKKRISSRRKNFFGIVGGIALVPLALLYLSTFVTVLDLKVRTARPAPVSWEWIEGNGFRLLFDRTLLWTDGARVRVSAPGHQSAEAVLFSDGSGSSELTLEPLPGVAEIEIAGEGPITLSVDRGARQAGPSLRIELAEGPHKAILAGPNIVPTEIDFEIQGFGNVQQFRWSAASANSFLDVQVQPQTAEVLLDGQPWAIGSRKAGVPLGQHMLSAKIPGWYSKSEQFEAVADNTASFHWTLRPKPAVLALSTEPSGVAVLLNGDYVGQSPVSLDLQANKRHVISARQSGRDPVELALSPAPGERITRTLRLAARTAKVAFSANGSATIRVNGVHAGTLPLEVELREGDRVEAVADGLAAAPYVVTKLEGVTDSHRFQLMPPAQLAHRSTPDLEEVLPGLQLKRIPWSAMGAAVSRPFRIAAQEVTYAAYSELLPQSPPSGLTAQHPIVNISWTQAAQFTNALSTKLGLPPVYVFDRSGNLLSVNQQSLGFRLPTEAEWLTAAGPDWARPKGAIRPNWAGSERRAGPQMPSHTDRWLELAPAQQAVLGTFDLRGMAGNAAEWLHDYYAPWPSSPPPDYAGPSLGIDHAVRGGSYLTAEKPDARGFSAKGRPDLGFRVAQWLH